MPRTASHASPGPAAVPVAHHVSRETSAGERGRAFGAALAPAIAVTVRTYRRLLAEVADLTPGDMRARGAALEGSLGERWPELVEELDGMAAGAGQDLRDLIAVNARTELLAGTGRAECSVIGSLRGSDVSVAQTWDWHPDLAPARVVWTVNFPDGAWFSTATEAGILAKLGLNSHGLACALNFLACSADGGTDGVPIHLLLRLLLERAKDASQAIELLCGERTSASSAVTVAYAAGLDAELLAVELSPGGATVVRPDAHGWLIHTNHFLSPPARGVDREPLAGPGSHLRRDRLSALVRDGVAPLEALGSHLPAQEPVCRHTEFDAGAPWEDRLATLLTIEIDPGAHKFNLAAGPACSAPFVPIPLPVNDRISGQP
jgi:isopenicillin-N N-acyltransferase-like protein